MFDTPAVIFAGGRSSRMGEDKALMPFGENETLAQFQYEKLSKLFEEVYLSSKSDKFLFEAAWIRDLSSQSSPLVALISVFETLQSDEIFILGVDIPFVDKEVIDLIFSGKNDTYDAVIAKTAYGIQPLCGIYHRNILPLAKAQLERDIHKLQHLLKVSNTNYILIEDEKKFLNLNTALEYEKALAIYPPESP